jgi:multidrug efflux system membrane fusion protein
MGTPTTQGLHEPGSPFDAPPGPSTAHPKRRWWIWLVVFVVLALGIWYWRRASAQRAASTAASAQAAAANRAVPVVVATARRGDMPVYLRALGTVTAYNTVTLHSRVDGQLIKVAFKEGEFARQGDLLVEIDPRPFQVQLAQAQGQLARDMAQLNDAQVNANRYEALFQAGVIPKQQLDTQVAMVGQFDGAIKSDQAQIDNAKLQLTYSRITAPISGRIGLRLIDPGNIVHASDQNGLLVITQLQPINVIFSLPQDNLPEVNQQLRAGAKLPVDAYDQANVTKLASGTLLTIDNQIDPTTGTYKLKAVFNNENNALFSNQFVNVRMLLGTKQGLIVVPAQTIQRGPQGTFVYVVTPAGAATVRSVTVAITEGDSVGISNGLQEGDTVVTDGQDKLQEGTKVEARQGGPAPNASRPK